MSRPESQSAKSWQISHGGVDHSELDDYLQRNDTPSKQTILELHKIRSEHTTLRKNVWSRISDTDKRKILATVYFSKQRGVRYDSLIDRLQCSERTIYRKLKDMDEAGIVDRVGKPAVVVFPSRDARLLVGDILSAYHDN